MGGEKGRGFASGRKGDFHPLPGWKKIKASSAFIRLPSDAGDPHHDMTTKMAVGK